MSNVIFKISARFLQHGKWTLRCYITKIKKNCFSGLGSCRRIPDNGDAWREAPACAVLVHRCQHLPAEQHTLFISTPALLTFGLQACWLVSASWYYDSALHIKVDLILHWYLMLHVWMTLANSIAGNQLNDKAQQWYQFLILKRLMHLSTASMQTILCSKVSIYCLFSSCQHSIKYKLVSPEWVVTFN